VDINTFNQKKDEKVEILWAKRNAVWLPPRRRLANEWLKWAEKPAVRSGRRKESVGENAEKS